MAMYSGSHLFVLVGDGAFTIFIYVGEQ